MSKGLDRCRILIAQTAYDEVVTPAWEAYKIARRIAKKARKRAVKIVRHTLSQKTTALWVRFMDNPTADARNLYKAKTEAVRAEYDTAIEAAQATETAALQCAWDVFLSIAEPMQQQYQNAIAALIP